MEKSQPRSVEVNVPSDFSAQDFDKKHDAALDFIIANKDGVNTELYLDPTYCRRVRRKVDYIIMPFLLLCYTMNLLDKALLNFANVMGLSDALHLAGNDFSNANSAFFIAIVVMVIPNIFLLQRLPVAKLLAFDILIWGIITTCHAALHNSAGLIAVRVLCGIFESAVPSALMLITSQYYTKSEQSLRYVYWFSGLGIGQMVGALLSFAFQHVQQPATSPTAGWRMMFVALGCFTVLVGMATFIFVPDTVMQAQFLTVEERINLLKHVRANQTGIKNTHFQPKQILEAFLDPQTWPMFLLSIMQGIAGATIALYSATLLKTFGYSSLNAALLNIPSGAINLVSMILIGIAARFYGRRFIWTSIPALIAAVGAALLSFLSTKNQSGSLAGIYLMNFSPAGYPVINQWILANTAGHTKRTYVAAGMNAAFALGNVIGPQTFQDRNKPEYKPAKLTAFASQLVTLVLLSTLAVYYTICNQKRDARGQAVADEDLSDSKAYAGLTDKQNADFRYVI